ncbi:MAG: hypothetical protein ACMUIP_00940 [bacterium]
MVFDSKCKSCCIRETMRKKEFFLLSLFGLIILLFMVRNALAFDFRDIADIGAAYTTHLFLHEMGHHIVANRVGAENHKIALFVQEKGKFYPGLAFADTIPEGAVLPYAVGGELLAAQTFEYGLHSYRHEPTTFNKALMFFSTADFLVYTLIGNYINDDNEFYDTNMIREETGCDKEALLSIVIAKTMLNTYRIMSGNDRFIPVIRAERDMTAFMVQYRF